VTLKVGVLAKFDTTQSPATKQLLPGTVTVLVIGLGKGKGVSLILMVKGDVTVAFAARLIVLVQTVPATEPTGQLHPCEAGPK
jgi:hypothetical protein